jgi:Arc/MetJ-type ribon-helix-helix transcriptional regulator
MVMETVQIRLTEKQIRNIEVLVKKGVYPNRSEAVRDAVRKLVEGNGE